MAIDSSNSIGDFEAQAHFPEMLEKVAAGEEITITRQGAPIARLVPVGKRHTVEERRAAIERIIKRRENLSLGGLKIRDLINEGRR